MRSPSNPGELARMDYVLEPAGFSTAEPYAERLRDNCPFGPSLDTIRVIGVTRMEPEMKTGMFAWLIFSALCLVSLAYGQVALSAYFLVLSCVAPPFVAKELRQRRRERS